MFFGNLTLKGSNTRLFPLLLSSVSFKASAVRHGPQQPSGSEPCSFSTRLQQFRGGDSPRTPSDTCYVCTATLFIQLCWGLRPSALSRGAAQDPAPQHRFLHGMENRTLCVCVQLCVLILSNWGEISNLTVGANVVHCLVFSQMLLYFWDILVHIVTSELEWCSHSSTCFPFFLCVHLGASVWGIGEKQWQAAINWQPGTDWSSFSLPPAAIWTSQTPPRPLLHPFQPWGIIFLWNRTL